MVLMWRPAPMLRWAVVVLRPPLMVIIVLLMPLITLVMVIVAAVIITVAMAAALVLVLLRVIRPAVTAAVVIVVLRGVHWRVGLLFLLVEIHVGLAVPAGTGPDDVTRAVVFVLARGRLASVLPR